MNMQHLCVLLFVWLQTFYAANTMPDTKKRNSPPVYPVPTIGEKTLCGDVAFLIDTSSSMSNDEFDTEKEFVQKIIEQFDIGSQETQVAALTFGNTVKVKFHFNTFHTTGDIINKVSEMKHEAQDATFTDQALKRMQSDLFSYSNGARWDVPKIGILLSDGGSTNREYTLEEATKAKNAGYTLLAIGVGKVNKTELKAVVSAPAENNFFYVKTFEDLKSGLLQRLVGMQACKAAKTTTEAISTPQPIVPTTEKSKCDAEKECEGKSADVVFVLDMSSSIWGPFFNDSLRFVNKVIDIFDVGSGKTQIGALSFSDNVNVAFDLNKYDNKADISNAVLNIGQANGNTYTHKALNTVTNRMFAPGYGSRPFASHICILMTDGKSRMPQVTKQSAANLKNKGIFMFAIGVGNQTDTVELTDIASKPTDEYMFEVNSFSALSHIKDTLAYKACQVFPPYNGPPNNDSLLTKTLVTVSQTTMPQKQVPQAVIGRLKHG